MSTTSTTSTTLPIHHHPYQHQHQHHHHYMGIEQQQQQPNNGSHHHHHHLHHYHYQPRQSQVSSISETIDEATQSKCCNVCWCSNRLLTGIVITILPIAITFTLICVFMMQKTNLHQYAIYSFVIFCVAFVFPFALFFFTVILNKVRVLLLGQVFVCL